MKNLVNADALKAVIDRIVSMIFVHFKNKENPHAVTKEQIGLGNCDNTSDANKPISTIAQSALDGKESTSNRVTTIDASSASTAYPSAPAVYNLCKSNKHAYTVQSLDEMELIDTVSEHSI